MLNYIISIKERGQIHIYPYDSKDPTGPKRTNESYLTDLEKAISLKTPVNGVKGKCPLSRLKYFNVPSTQTCIDYMHSLLEGVVKNLMNYWFETGEFLGEHSLRGFMQEIDKRLMSIKPPKFVPYTPRSIYSHNLWHAHEYLAFILYYALPVFKDIIKDILNFN